MTRSPPTTEADFQKLMAEVDRQLQSEMVPIPSRPMRAESILAKRLGEPFVHPYPRRDLKGRAAESILVALLERSGYRVTRPRRRGAF
jgi:hypothetical protein